MMKYINRNLRDKLIFTAQYLSISLMWVFVIGITLWIINLIYLSVDLKDAPGISIGISLVAIPVFLTLAGILTYVFVGFHSKGKNNFINTPGD
ncbi:hypothetical protein A2V55_01950 [Candidatus Woesebacteria bacterium RBG_19FT_COMBO_37_29]|uniref:Uncharacterized protein n=1 Tax=Candidatus Woesebacteria bacterium RBG_19FT_COMBO_37_29 TaxID=1802486 RepID=A0A1F7XNF4_9BACT|nr:MAG: hypothetical protein A2V55_01950 [Candidatus Woesebacteria bacterium RBG_19FT_COMBO_37_29]